MTAISGRGGNFSAPGLWRTARSTSPEVEEKNFRGEYFVPYGKKATPSALARDEALAKKLWDFSVDLVKERVPGFEVPASLRA